MKSSDSEQTWLDADDTPPASLAKCGVCNGLMSLLLQLNGDLPEHFPDDERRIYVQICRKKQCRRKLGSIQAFRAVKKHRTATPQTPSASAAPKTEDIGSRIFGAERLPKSSNANPFAQSSGNTSNGNPFPVLPALAAKSPQATAEESLSAKLSSELQISSNTAPEKSELSVSEPWPEETSFPKPFPHIFLESDYEYLIPETRELPIDTSSKVQYEEESSTSNKDQDKDIFESTMDKTFIKFSDRLAQNPEQVIRYEYKGSPLLYSDSDEVGKKLSVPSTKISTATEMPKCEACGSERVFEVQLVPGAIEVVEDSEAALEDGMDWGTIIVGACSKDCGEVGRTTFQREWCGVQWE